MGFLPLGFFLSVTIKQLPSEGVQVVMCDEVGPGFVVVVEPVESNPAFHARANAVNESRLRVFTHSLLADWAASTGAQRIRMSLISTRRRGRRTSRVGSQEFAVRDAPRVLVLVGDGSSLLWSWKQQQAVFELDGPSLSDHPQVFFPWSHG